MSKVYKIKGMDCVSCAMLIESDLEDEGINCDCNFAKTTLEVHDHTPEIEEKVRTVVENAGIFAPVVYILASLVSYIIAPLSNIPVMAAGHYSFGSERI